MAEAVRLDDIPSWSYSEDKDKNMRALSLVKPPDRKQSFGWEFWEQTFSTLVSPSEPAFVGDPLSRLIDQWVHIACSHARTRRIGNLVVADVAGLEGAWAQGDTADEARANLPSVLTEWVRLKLADGDDDIPPMEGVRLTVDS